MTEARRPRILVSNDDGYFSQGLQALVDAVSPLGEVWVVAPDREQSAASHAISLHRPLRIQQIRERWYAVDGTPTDSAYLAIHHILKDARPTLMVSGINHGANLADDVTYSGTVAAAMEGALLGVPSIAFSLASRPPFDFGPAARFARALVTAALSQPLPPRMLLNVNIPGGVEPDGYAVTRLGRHSYGYEVVENVDPRGRKYYWIGGTEYEHEDIPGSDCNAVHLDKRVSVTPLHLDLTAHERISDLSGWSLEGFRRFSSGGA
ncbi:MAG TPA: 5'/3'-nucleotidase SurE [Myxococcaceae bacterium]